MAWIIIQAAGNIPVEIVLDEPYTFVNLTGLSLALSIALSASFIELFFSRKITGSVPYSAFSFD